MKIRAQTAFAFASPPAPRRCTFCNRRLKKSARADAETCSQSCRQKRARAGKKAVAKTSKKVLRARRLADERVMTRAAKNRTAIPSELLGADARAASSGRYGVAVAGAKGVAIE